MYNLALTTRMDHFSMPFNDTIEIDDQHAARAEQIKAAGYGITLEFSGDTAILKVESSNGVLTELDVSTSEEGPIEALDDLLDQAVAALPA